MNEKHKQKTKTNIATPNSENNFSSNLISNLYRLYFEMNVWLTSINKQELRMTFQKVADLLLTEKFEGTSKK